MMSNLFSLEEDEGLMGQSVWWVCQEVALHFFDYTSRKFCRCTNLNLREP